MRGHICMRRWIDTYMRTHIHEEKETHIYADTYIPS
jgi:hypothetical protein